jgi:hypothetical protein
MLPRPFLIPAVCALTALASACDDNSVRISSSRSENNDATGVLRVVETLQCPQTIGSLTRKGSATEQGTVCTYNGPKGAEVVLHLVSLRGTDAVTALKGFEARLSTSLPDAAAQIRASASADAATANASGSSNDTASVRAPGVAIDASGDNASVRAPGVAIESQGDKASVRLPGISINADGDNASVRIGGFHVDADNEGAVVNVSDGEGGDAVSVRANQDAAVVRTNASGPATRSNWILTDNRDSAAGWRLVGYEARGPAGGPIVVATVRSKDREGGRVFDDAKDLVSLNVGE